MRKQLEHLPPHEIVYFQQHFENAVRTAYRWDLWAAAYIINGGCSDDGFMDFLNWLISEGSHTYSEALKSPDSLALLEPVDYAGDELFDYVASELLDEKILDEEILDAGNENENEKSMIVNASLPAGKQWSEEELPELLPDLAKLYEF